MKKSLAKNVLLFVLAAFAAASPADAQSQTALSFSAGKFFQSRIGGDRQERVDTVALIRTELFFGRNKPDATEVSEEEFADFLLRTITPEFSDGLTVLDGIGQFRDADGNTIREKAKVLILLYPARFRKQISRKIERIRAAYKSRFAQQSVLRVDAQSLVRVSF